MTKAFEFNGTSRRRVLGGFGAAGLAVAATVFGRTQAEAATDLVKVGCCNLIYNSSHTLSQCESGGHYVWFCSSYSFPYVTNCNCCEHDSPAYSTASCTTYTT